MPIGGTADPDQASDHTATGGSESDDSLDASGSDTDKKMIGERLYPLIQTALPFLFLLKGK